MSSCSTSIEYDGLSCTKRVFGQTTLSVFTASTILRVIWETRIFTHCSVTNIRVPFIVWTVCGIDSCVRGGKNTDTATSLIRFSAVKGKFGCTTEIATLAFPNSVKYSSIYRPIYLVRVSYSS